MGQFESVRLRRSFVRKGCAFPGPPSFGKAAPCPHGVAVRWRFYIFSPRSGRKAVSQIRASVARFAGFRTA